MLLGGCRPPSAARTAGRPRGALPRIVGITLALLLGAGSFASLSAQVESGDPEAIAEAEEFEPAPAGEAQPGDKSLITRFSFYNHGDSGDGNPFVDEALTVIEPVIIFDHTVSETFAYTLDFHYDYVSSASIDRLSNFPEQSGASADNYIGFDLAGRWKLSDGWRVGAHAGFSDEYDYDSIGFGGNVSRDLAGKDATIGLSLNTYFDDIRVIRFDGSEAGGETRTSISTTASWYQVISPTVHGTFGATVSLQDGFLSTAYNGVVIENPADPPNPTLDNNARGTEVAETLPATRMRLALFGRVRTSLAPGKAYELGGRIYSDDWGVTSFTFEPRWYQTLIPGKLDGMIRYRFYTQTAADDYEDHFFAVEKFMTQDSDLADLDSHTLGGRLTYHLGRDDSLSIGLDYVLRSDGLDQILATFAWEHRF